MPCGGCASPSFTWTGGHLCLSAYAIHQGATRLVTCSERPCITCLLQWSDLLAIPCLSSQQTLPLSKTTFVHSILHLFREASGSGWHQDWDTAHRDVPSPVSAEGGLEVSAACEALVEKMIPFPLDNCKWLCSASHRMPKHFQPCYVQCWETWCSELSLSYVYLSSYVSKNAFERDSGSNGSAASILWERSLRETQIHLYWGVKLMRRTDVWIIMFFPA